MSQIEAQYDGFLSTVSQTLSNADTNLLMKVMYLERKLSDVAPRVELYMEYKSNVDPTRKQEEMRAKYGFPTQTSSHRLTVVGQMTVDIIENISKDPEVEHISGTATPASY